MSVLDRRLLEPILHPNPERLESLTPAREALDYNEGLLHAEVSEASEIGGCSRRMKNPVPVVVQNLNPERRKLREWSSTLNPEP